MTLGTFLVADAAGAVPPSAPDAGADLSEAPSGADDVGQAAQPPVGRGPPFLAPVQASIARVFGFVRPKLADAADLFMVGVIVFALAVSIINRSWIFTGHALTASIVGFALCYLITSRALRPQRDLRMTRIFLSLAVMASGVWLYEIAYHYGWGVTWAGFWAEASTLSINTPMSGSVYPLPWSILMVALVFTGIRYMRLNRWFFLTLALSLITFGLWIAVGYPGYFNPQVWPHGDPMLDLIPPGFAHSTRGTPAGDVIAFYGGLFNSLTKILVSILPATLYVTSQRPKGPPSNEPEAGLFPRLVQRLRAMLPGGESKVAAPAALPAIEQGQTRGSDEEDRGDKP